MFDGAGSFVVFLLVLSGVVFVHELGHFLVARLFRVQVDEFAVGFPPRLVGAARDADGRWRVFFGPRAPSPAELGGRRTIYSLNLVPIGGYVRLAGEDDPSIPGGLASASKTARIATLAAGAGFNLIFALIVFIVGFRLGWPDRVNIVAVVPDTPAQAGGLQPGDIILQAGQRDVHYLQQMVDATYSNLGRPLELLLDRAGEQVRLTVTPRSTWPEGQGPMGIQMGQTVVTDYSWPEAVTRAGQEMYYQLEVLVHLPGRIFRQEIPLEAARPCGPVCINDLTRQALETSQAIDQWFPLIQLIGLISVALAVTNLLPLPALDGGRIVFVLIEAVRGRRMNPAREGLVHLVGLVMLLVLMVVFTYQDIVNPIIPR